MAVTQKITGGGRYIGLSTDTATITGQPGYERYYTDTGDTYVMDAAGNWVLRPSPIPFLHSISDGKLSNYATWSKTGYNPDIDTGTEDLWVVGGTFAFPASAMQMEVVSTGAQDKSDGTGIRTVILTYLDDTYTERTETITLNGATAVPTVATNILRISNFRAASTGTGLVAAGDIDVRHLSDSPIYTRIATGYTRARNAAYTVPLGKTLYITSARFSAIAAVAACDVLFTVRATYDDKAQLVRTFFMPIIELGVQDGAIHIPFELPIKLPATVDIKVGAVSGNNNAVCSSVLRGYLVS